MVARMQVILFFLAVSMSAAALSSEVHSGEGGQGVAAMGLEPRDPHAYSEGRDFGPWGRPRFVDEYRFASLWVDELDWLPQEGSGQWAYDLQGWYGRDYSRLVFKGEGEGQRGEWADARTEVLWSKAFSAFWDAQFGVRLDGGGPVNRRWLAVGVQGLAPYWFEMDIAAYVGEGGRTALRMDMAYELLFTQRLILEPSLELDWYGQDDVARGIGRGLSELVAGLRLRYEIRREFAPYLGLEWAGAYGRTADLIRAAGDPVSEANAVAGVRFWF